MIPNNPKPAAPSPALLGLYNAVPNVFWSVLGLAPVSIFCYQHLPLSWLYGLGAVGLLAYVLPKQWFGLWQLSRTPAAYRRLGVPRINYVTQQGRLVKGWLRRRYPEYSRLLPRTAGAALRRTTYHYERFHLGLLGVFLLVSLYAAAHGYVGWAALITLTNVGYNLYPVWLQQYIRLRLPA